MLRDSSKNFKDLPNQGVPAMNYILLILLFFSFNTRAQDICPAKVSSEVDLLRLAQTHSQNAKKIKDFRKKSELAREGLNVAERCLALNPKNIACLYYRAVNRGLDLETRMLGIKDDLKKMLADFRTVADVNPYYDNGGAYLALGYVFLKAPTLPILGEDIQRDLGKAESYAHKALEVAAKDPFNLKFAGEVAYKKKDFGKALQYFTAAEQNVKNAEDADEAAELKQELVKWIKKSKK